MAFDKVSYDNDYTREKYDRFSVFLPKGTKDVVKRVAAEKGVSVNQLFTDALASTYGIKIDK